MTDSRITLDSSKRGGRPCIRNLRISVYDVLEMLAEGMSEADIIEDFRSLNLRIFAPASPLPQTANTTFTQWQRDEHPAKQKTRIQSDWAQYMATQK